MSVTAADSALRKKGELHHGIAKKYEALYHETGYFVRIELQERDIDTKKSADILKSLSDKFIQLNQSSPPIPGSAYREANRLLENNSGEVVRDPDEFPSIDPKGA